MSPNTVSTIPFTFYVSSVHSDTGSTADLPIENQFAKRAVPLFHTWTNIRYEEVHWQTARFYVPPNKFMNRPNKIRSLTFETRSSHIRFFVYSTQDTHLIALL